jgi:hypothetical protein
VVSRSHAETTDTEERSVFVILAAPPPTIAMQLCWGVSVTPSGPRQQSAASASENQETGGVAHYSNVPFAWCDVF